ncbi:DUF4328 domain-containing protein [Streptosporangium carneum]|uniref:DUF4328 domain-containing protein n=1 Tax=Streptosporangium carneum TaxID=47481 RepID=UPI0022F30B1C|nr:DUF4328 domain-containing protein [Streptosporangium carneum]
MPTSRSWVSPPFNQRSSRSFVFVPEPRPLERLVDLAVVALVALFVDVLAEIAIMLAGPTLAAASRILAEESGMSADTVLDWLLILLHLSTSAPAGMTFMFWLLQARLNAQSLTRVPHRWLKTFILVGWFVPVVNCWLPKQIVDDIWASSRPGGVRGGNIARETHSGLVWAWWILWLLANGMTWLSTWTFAAPGHRGLAASILLNAFFLFPTVVAAILQAAVILRITHFQENHVLRERRLLQERRLALQRSWTERTEETPVGSQ